MSWLSKILGGGNKKVAADVKAQPPLSEAKIRIDRQDFVAVELGIRSFRIHPYDGGLIARQNFEFSLIFTVNGEEIEMPGRGVVKSQDDNDGLRALFGAPQPFYQKMLTQFLIAQKQGGKR
ncbi:PilZ domain-containing protein [uncultured Gammaproteobacteria bacterium]